MKQRNIAKVILANLLICALFLSACSSPFSGGSEDGKDDPYRDYYKNVSLDQENYYVYAHAYGPTGALYSVVTEVLADQDAIQTSVMASEADVSTQIDIVTKSGISVCNAKIGDQAYSFWCQSNILEGEELGLLTGPTMYDIVQSALSHGVYSEQIDPGYLPTGHEGEDAVKIITSSINPETNALEESHCICSVNEKGDTTSFTTPCEMNGYMFNITMETQRLVEIEPATTDTAAITSSEMINFANSVLDAIFAAVFTDNTTSSIEQSDIPEEETEEPVVEEQENTYMAQEIATLTENKDLFVKLTFSNYISDDITFIAPTGGQYSVATNNVEMMCDDTGGHVAYYRIPGAEIGTWILKYNNSENEISYETVTDNKIKIQKVTTTPVKDGMTTVSATLSTAKGTDITYEYHLTVDQYNETKTHTTGIKNTKKDKPDYDFSVLNVEPGTYKLRFRIEYMYNDQKYFNIFTVNDFTID